MATSRAEGPVSSSAILAVRSPHLDRLRGRLDPATRYERKLRELSDPRHWSRHDRLQKLRRRASSFSLGLRQGGDSAREDARVIAPLLWRVVIGAFLSVALLVGVDAIAAWISRFFHFGSLFTSVTSGSYFPLATAGVGALAVFLAFLFTTVGVIASTAYVKVPGEIGPETVRQGANLDLLHLHGCRRSRLWNGPAHVSRGLRT